MSKKQDTKNSTYKQILIKLLPFKGKIFLSLLCTLGYVLTMPSIAYLIGKASEFIANGDLAELIKWSAGSLVLFLLRGICQFFQDTLIADISLRIIKETRVRAYEKIQSFNINFFENQKAGELTYRITEEIEHIGVLIKSILYRFIPSILTTLAVVIYIIYLSWKLTIAIMIIAPLITFLFGLFGNLLLKQSHIIQSHLSSFASHITEIFSGIMVIKAFAAEEYAIQKFKEYAKTSYLKLYKAEKIKSMQYPILGLFEAFSIMLLFMLGTWEIKNGQLETSEFISFASAVALLMEPVHMLSASFNEIKVFQASVERTLELLSRKSTIEEDSNLSKLPSVSGKIEYRNVSFGYNQDKLILKNFNLVINPGEVIAFVGQSGAGKSTIVNLLLRFYEPSNGKILIDDIDISKVTLKSLRRQIGLVPQENILFSGTIADNIAFGDSSPDWKKIVKAAEIANVHEFINKLSDGYYTWIGERGATLSGGQKQRLAIARAIYTDPKILVLDEATSALDSESEMLVQSALEKAMIGRTVIIIAHRLTTVKRADRILVIEKGRIIESGSHEELIKISSRYNQFYQIQKSK